MDIKAKIEEIVNKIKSDPKMLQKFNDNPTETLESLIGIDLPDDQINQLVEGIKAKLTMERLAMCWVVCSAENKEVKEGT